MARSRQCVRPYLPNATQTPSSRPSTRPRAARPRHRGSARRLRSTSGGAASAPSAARPISAPHTGADYAAPPANAPLPRDARRLTPHRPRTLRRTLRAERYFRARRAGARLEHGRQVALLRQAFEAEMAAVTAKVDPLLLQASPSP